MILRATLVVGYLPGLDRWPADARAACLPHRRALALVAPRDAATPFAHPARILVDALLQDLLMRHPGEQQAVYSLLTEAALRTDVRIGSPDEPVALVRAVDFGGGGGPAPYHDSLTVEAYTADPADRDALVRRTCEAAFRLGVPVGEIRDGEAVPTRRRWAFRA